MLHVKTAETSAARFANARLLCRWRSSGNMSRTADFILRRPKRTSSHRPRLTFWQMTLGLQRKRSPSLTKSKQARGIWCCAVQCNATLPTPAA